MKRITVTVATGLLIAIFACPGAPRAQSEPQAVSPNAKITLKGLAAQVATLQTTVSSLQTMVSSQQTALSSLQTTVQGLANFAVVASNGTLVRGSSSAVGASLLGIGVYAVDFDRDVSQCAYVATIGDTDSGGAASGEISVATRNGDSHGVFVETGDSSGSDSSRPFHLSVSCP
jgi:hypothetical protein